MPGETARRILTALGARELSFTAERVEVIPPTWRRDLEREIDLVEEVGRIHGYEHIPEDARVPMVPSHRTRDDRVLARVRHVLTAAGFDEALTLSAVDQAWSEAFSPWTSEPALQSSTPVLRRADRLRRSLVPSLLGARRTNESLANPVIELFETAKVYLPQTGGRLPDEQLMLALTSGRSFADVKGALEALVAALDPAARVAVRPADVSLLDRQRCCQLWLVRAAGEELLGYLGQVGAAGLKQFELRSPTTVAEVRLAVLIEAAQLIPQQAALSVFPAMTRDLNLELAEAVSWAEIERTVSASAGGKLESLEFREDYRNRQQVPPGQKRLLFSFALRSHESTLTGDEADAIRDRIVQACQSEHGARLVM